MMSIEKASQNFYGSLPRFYGEGFSIPLVGDLESLYPEANILVTGILGPKNNAHGPNENLDIEYTKKFVCSIAYILTEECALNF